MALRPSRPGMYGKRLLLGDTELPQQEWKQQQPGLTSPGRGLAGLTRVQPAYVNNDVRERSDNRVAVEGVPDLAHTPADVS
jgi:hypothetical protein